MPMTFSFYFYHVRGIPRVMSSMFRFPIRTGPVSGKVQGLSWRKTASQHKPRLIDLFQNGNPIQHSLMLMSLPNLAAMGKIQ